MVIKDLFKKSPLLRKLSYQFLFWLRGNEKNEVGSDNQIIHEGAQLERCKIEISGSGNRLYFAPGCSVKDCSIVIYGNNHILNIEEAAVLTQSTLWFEDHHCEISIGHHTTMQRFGHIAVTEPYRKIQIGPRCMFSFNIDIRNGDSHTLFEIETRERINWAKDIWIGEHVWLGSNTQIMGGTEIGENTTIGLRSMVKGKIPANCIAVGNPARVAKSGFNWDSIRWTEGDPVNS